MFMFNDAGLRGHQKLYGLYFRDDRSGPTVLHRACQALIDDMPNRPVCTQSAPSHPAPVIPGGFRLLWANTRSNAMKLPYARVALWPYGPKKLIWSTSRNIINEERLIKKMTAPQLSAHVVQRYWNLYPEAHLFIAAIKARQL